MENAINARTLPEIKPAEHLYINGIVDMAYENYCLEQTHVKALESLDRNFFSEYIRDLIANGVGNIVFESEKMVGYLLFNVYPEYNSAVSPLYGYGISHPQRGDIISKLFQKTASELCEKYYQNLQVSIYAHDSEVLWHYILGSFIMELTDVVRDTDSLISTKPCQYAFKEISKSELLNHKQNVIEFYRNLINHLRLSPVFYPCHEFLPIEDRFTDFLADDIRVFAAFDGENVIGMVISEASDIWPGLNEKNAVNLSDLFVAPAYRGNGIAAALLDFTSNALKKSGIKKIYVTHGTVNPTAVGFWDKYFSNYAYRFSRQIDSEMLGVIKPVQNDNCISRRII